MKRQPVLIIAVLAVFAIILGACIQAGVNIPKPAGYVNDFAKMMTSGERSALEAKLRGYKEGTGNEITVVTIESLGGQTIEQYSIELAEKWGVGKKGQDNGVVLLVSKEDRKLRIEVGYGLEGVLTDAASKIIIEREIVPRFKQEKFADGINSGVDAIIAVIGGTYKLSSVAGEGKKSDVTFPFWIWIIIAVVGGIVLIILVGAAGNGSSGGGVWVGGTRGGSRTGGGGFGGGGFGGGGASGGW